jgi:hypothetical protein
LRPHWMRKRTKSRLRRPLPKSISLRFSHLKDFGSQRNPDQLRSDGLCLLAHRPLLVARASWALATAFIAPRSVPFEVRSGFVIGITAVGSESQDCRDEQRFAGTHAFRGTLK